jgi:hypothetical protein
MPDPSDPLQPPRKHRRFWLFAPYVLALIVALVWSGVWWTEKLKVEHEITRQAAELTKQGYTARWQAMKVGGWPFRLHVALTAPEAGDSAGWRLTAPRILAQAMAWAPDIWVIAAPDGLELTRPGEGALAVSGKMIRASIGGLKKSERPRFSLEGDGLSLTAAQGARPAAFTAIDKLELHLQPGPNDQAALLVRIDGGTLRPDAGLAKLASGKPLQLVWDSRLTKLSAFKGSNWPGALQAWRNAGGQMTVVDAELGLGGQKLKGEGGPLAVDTDGRLSGQLALKVEGVGGALMRALGLGGPVPLSFKDGRAAIGPAPVGQALKIG